MVTDFKFRIIIIILFTKVNTYTQFDINRLHYNIKFSSKIRSSLKDEVDQIDIDKLKAVSVNLSKLSNVV